MASFVESRRPAVNRKGISKNSALHNVGYPRRCDEYGSRWQRDPTPQSHHRVNPGPKTTPSRRAKNMAYAHDEEWRQSEGHETQEICFLGRRSILQAPSGAALQRCDAGVKSSQSCRRVVSATLNSVRIPVDSLWKSSSVPNLHHSISTRRERRCATGCNFNLQGYHL